MNRCTRPNTGVRRRAPLGGAMILAALLALPSARAQQLDVCNCEDLPSPGTFDSCDTSTYPPGTTVSGPAVGLTMPADGVLVFDNFYVKACRGGTDYVWFRKNAANTPVTLLIKGEFRVDTGAYLNLYGSNGGAANSNGSGSGGAPGPGGFRGGDGGHSPTRGTILGGAGLGGGGGDPSAAIDTGSGVSLNSAGDGRYLGARTGLPATGGSGGGGGSETGAGGSCSGGGGGGGGGAVTIAANERIHLNGGQIYADGGVRGGPGNTGCSTYGGHGSGGLIRLLSSRTIGAAGGLYARGGQGNSSRDGIIRIESFNDSISTSNVDPPAIRTRVISPVFNPIASSVVISEIDGSPVPQPPRGNVGLIDLLVDSPGLITMRVDTAGVPGGTVIEVSVKPDVGGPPAIAEVELDPANCDSAGACFTFATFDLGEGAYYAEATATYRTP